MLQTVNVKNDEAKFSTPFNSIRDVRVLIAPADEGNQNIESVADLARYKPYEPVFSIQHRRNNSSFRYRTGIVEALA